MRIINWEPILDLNCIFTKSKRMPYPFDTHQTYFFGYARVALLQGLKILRIKAGDNVLIPSYICNVVLAPFNYLGIETRYFEVDVNLRPRLDQIERLIDHKTKAILTVNYFGFPIFSERIKMICRRNNLFFIEDNAHGFLSKKDKRALGTFGDISIFSMRKTLDIPNGAALVVNNEEINTKRDNLILTSSNDFIYFLRQIKQHFEFFTGIKLPKPLKIIFKKKYFTFSTVKRTEEERNIDRYFIKQSPFTNLVIKRIDISGIVDRRKRGFEYWLEHLPEGEAVFKELPQGVVPYVFPVRTKDTKGFIKRMLIRGIECSTWPTLPGYLKDYPDFYRQIVVIPLWKNYGNQNN